MFSFVFVSFNQLTQFNLSILRDMMERLTLIHSNAWTCAVTKQSGLTLEEAFQSEKV